MSMNTWLNSLRGVYDRTPRPRRRHHRRSWGQQQFVLELHRLENRLLLTAGVGNQQLEFQIVSPELIESSYTESSNVALPDNFGLDATVTSGDTEPLAPAVSSTINGITFDENTTNTNFLNIPPDPHGAVGPSHVVSVVNTSIEWHTKAGTQENSQRLGKNSSTAVGSFFSTLNPVNGLFDPKVIYDEHSGRFLVVVLEQTDTAFGDAANTSRMLIAVSDDSNPNGTWYYHAIDTKITISSVDTWADYPGLGSDEQAIYITNNMFNFGASRTFRGSRLWIINKGQGSGGFFDGGAASVTVHDPSTAAGVGGQLGTLQPAQVRGSGGNGSTVGTWMVSSGITFGASEGLGVIRVDNPLTSPSFTYTAINVGDISSTTSLPDAPQLGTSTLIDAGSYRIYDVEWRSNSLYAVNSVLAGSGTDTGDVTAHWFQISTSGTPALQQQGNIGAEDLGADTYTYYPSVAVDAANNVAFGFAASSATLYGGAYYTMRAAADPTGTVQSTGTVAAGQDYYIRLLGDSRNRWGDYSAIDVDPATPYTFWAFNEYAMSRGSIHPSFPTEDGRWATRWASFTAPGITITQSSGTTIVYENGESSRKTDSFTVVLTSQPTSNVVLNVSSNDPGEATVSPSTLTFTNANWNVAQSVTVSGVFDNLADGVQSPVVTVAVNDASSDDAYDAVADQTVNVTVNDVPLQVTVTGPTGGGQTSQPTVTWTGGSGASAYFLWLINRDGGTLVYQNSAISSGVSSFQIPTPLANGDYRVWVTALGTPSDSYAPFGSHMDFSVGSAAVPPTSPTVSGTTGAANQPQFNWNAPAGATRYSVYLINLGTGALVASQSGLTSPSFTPSSTLADGTYRLWVNAANGAGSSHWSTPFDYTVGTPVTVPSVPVITGTTDTGNPLRPQINWNASTGGGTINYTVYLINRQTGTLIASQSVGTATNFQPASNLTDNSAYRIWVNATNVAGSSGWTAPFDFLIGTSTPPAVPTGFSVTNTSTTTPTVDWADSATATAYEIYFINLDTGSFLASTTLGTSQYTTAPLTSGNYRIWVKSKNSAGSSGWSNPFDFLVTL